MREGAQIALNDLGNVALSVDEHSRAIAVAVVLDVSPKNFDGTLQGLAALPQPNRDGVTGLAHRSRTPIAPDQQRVFVDPGRSLLATWQDKTALYKLARL